MALGNVFDGLNGGHPMEMNSPMDDGLMSPIQWTTYSFPNNNIVQITTDGPHTHHLQCSYGFEDSENTPERVDVWCMYCSMKWTFDGRIKDEVEALRRSDIYVRELLDAKDEIARLKEIIQEMEGLNADTTPGSIPSTTIKTVNIKPQP